MQSSKNHNFWKENILNQMFLAREYTEVSCDIKILSILGKTCTENAVFMKIMIF